jgi:hypothetical protein
VNAEPQKPRTVVKTYHGREQQATTAFVQDSEVMARNGYFPTSQNYNPGSYGVGSFIIAALLCFVCIGIIVFIYMLVVKPPGVLTVTYELREEQSAATQPQTLSASPPPMRYFLLQGSEVTGPHDASLLRALRSAGQISNETLVCLEGSEQWTEVATVLP